MYRLHSDRRSDEIVAKLFHGGLRWNAASATKGQSDTAKGMTLAPGHPHVSLSSAPCYQNDLDSLTPPLRAPVPCYAAWRVVVKNK